MPVMTTTEPTARAKTALDRIADRIFPPMASLGERGTLVSPLVVIFVVSVATAAAMRALGWAAVGDAPIAAALQKWLLVIAALAPVMALVKAAVLAIVVWSVFTLLGATAPSRAILSSLLYGEALLALQAPVLLAVLAIQGGPREGAFPTALGLDAFVDPGHPVLLAIARGFTPFQIVWVAYLALAFASCASMSRAKGTAVSGTLWALLTGLGVLRAFLVSGGA